MHKREKRINSPSDVIAVVGVNQFAKIDLIRKFQRMEGNIDCCASAYSRVCKQFGCLWRNECQIMEPK